MVQNASDVRKRGSHLLRGRLERPSPVGGGGVCDALGFALAFASAAALAFASVAATNNALVACADTAFASRAARAASWTSATLATCAWALAT